MTDSSDSGATQDPTQLREEVEQELDELIEEASEEEEARMAERDRLGVDEPKDSTSGADADASAP
jgi:hypothetical protein